MQQDKLNSFIDLFENEPFIQQGHENQYNKFMLKVPPAIYTHPNFYYYPFTMPEQVNYSQLPLIQNQAIQESKNKQQFSGKKQKKSSKAAQKLEEKSTNLKNTYINKISSLINSEQKSSELLEKCKQHLKTGDNKQSKQIGNEECEKLARNRECARNSRKRKKVYIELLESKVKQMTEELNQIKKSNEQNLSSNNDIQDENVDNYFKIKEQLLENFMVQKSLDDDYNNLSQNQFREINKLKKKAMQGLLKEMINISVPVHQRYFMISQAMFSKDIVNQILDCQDRKWEKDIFAGLNVTEEQQSKLNALQGHLQQELCKFKKLKANTMQYCEELFQESQNMQHITNQTLESLDDSQKISFILQIQNQQNEEPLSMANICNLKNNCDL